ncbi:hypothetical protein KKJ06_20980 [Xenorhabdus bovienii]|uniref:immunity protein TriTu family protein n=1 Tax=Xenorhabdus bovienii TaxID=40576 RepID=UPI00237C6FB8|nr:hypothetical protein [Xenorhabdus bovienii]MDE1485667.1 hypothetical protein [Xenorhabdus bovienii]MDE9476370.1 hypothetical protein [Xenorhabdus bovienii]MDE9529261.1 hypothetical protein [Xenorhabdus bovienii]MDE9557811.1 hypothetical protein [Xenorhabdus bovienii]MDE9566698.1 hypothetical protein [Xenorhabdus bovienii]
MQKNILTIKNWIVSNYGYEVIINNNDLTESLVVDIEDERNIARFTAWDDRSCMLEIINVDTEQYIINERRELASDDEILEAFKEFNNLLL